MLTEKPLQVHFTLHCFDPPQKIGPEELKLYAAEIGMYGVASGRISNLLLAQVIAYTLSYGIEPERFTAEIKHLEGLAGYKQNQTKPAAPFNASGRLAGLHHKHFTGSTVAFVAANILAERPRNVLMRIAEEELGNGATLEALQRFTERVVLDGYERRASADRLTGEWIVFVEHEGEKHYLCLATHKGGDDEVLYYIQTVVRHEFPFLVDKLPHLFSP